MLTRVISAMAPVILTTLIGGALGGLVGYEVGRFSPQFVAWLAYYPPNVLGPQFRPEEFGLGLGIVSGLFFGAGSSLFVVGVMGFRDAWPARLALRSGKDPAEGSLRDLM